jgi:hypothetical protein
MRTITSINGVANQLLRSVRLEDGVACLPLPDALLHRQHVVVNTTSALAAVDRSSVRTPAAWIDAHRRPSRIWWSICGSFARQTTW